MVHHDTFVCNDAALPVDRTGKESGLNRKSEEEVRRKESSGRLVRDEDRSSSKKGREKNLTPTKESLNEVKISDKSACSLHDEVKDDAIRNLLQRIRGPQLTLKEVCIVRLQANNRLITMQDAKEALRLLFELKRDEFLSLVKDEISGCYDFLIIHGTKIQGSKLLEDDESLISINPWTVNEFATRIVQAWRVIEDAQGCRNSAIKSTIRQHKDSMLRGEYRDVAQRMCIDGRPPGESQSGRKE